MFLSSSMLKLWSMTGRNINMYADVGTVVKNGFA